MANRHAVQMIRKTCGGDGCGHCCNGLGWINCDFYDTSEIEKHDEFHGKCMLFGGAYKWSSQALFICDKIYGRNYEGAP